jgi:hypothetical protein
MASILAILAFGISMITLQALLFEILSWSDENLSFSTYLDRIIKRRDFQIYILGGSLAIL